LGQEDYKILSRIVPVAKEEKEERHTSSNNEFNTVNANLEKRENREEAMRMNGKEEKG
jgi:hypothetical protein